MDIRCHNCNHVFTYESAPPKFCSECGAALRAEESLADTAAYSAPPPEEAETLAPIPARRTHSRSISPHKMESFGPYKLIRLLGQGGMGVVWEAEEAESERRVALKLLSSGLTHDAKTVERFIQEGRLAAKLSHPRTTFIYGSGTIDEVPYITMELMPGETLQDVLNKESKLPIDRAVDYILDVIEGLIAAHELGVVHRDVKPSNCFMDRDGRVKVGDFGLSKSLVTESTLTQTGTFMGTPLFAAPEQVRGGDIDERTDIYAVGTTLFTMLAGQAPFSGDALAVTAQIVSDRAPLLSKFLPSVPKQLENIVAKTLEKDPAKRYQSLVQLRDALAPFATAGTSIADIGRRAGAYMIDLVLLTFGIQVFMSFLGFISGLGMARSPKDYLSSLPKMQLMAIVVQWILGVVYFVISETVWGKSIGKRIMGMQVCDMVGQRPHLGRNLIRSIFIPGTLAIPIIVEWISYLKSLDQPIDAIDLNFDTVMAGNILKMLVTLVPLAIFLSFMRKANGFRGLHDLASGTKVVRVSRQRVPQRIEQCPVIVASPLTSSERFGPFLPNGVLAASGNYRLLQATDDTLHRNVWLELVDDPSKSISRNHSLSRSGRLRWLQDGIHGNQRWSAFESISGAPLPQVAQNPECFPWRTTRVVLLKLAEELSVSIEDGSLPSGLTLDHIWVDQSTNVRLLDRPITSNGIAPRTSASNPDHDEGQAAIEVFVQAVELTTAKHVLPLSANEFVSQLKTKVADRTTLDWAVSQLRNLQTTSSDLTRYDRIGTLCMSNVIELSFWVFAFSFLSVSLRWLNLTAFIAALIACCILVVLNFAVGWYTHGSPLLHVMGLRIRNKDGSKPSRWQTGMRSVLTWLPVMLLMCFITPVAIAGLESIEARQKLIKKESAVATASSDPKASPNSNSATSKEPASNESKPNQLQFSVNVQGREFPMDEEREKEVAWLIIPLLVALVFQIVYLIGPIVALVTRDRGIQDYLLGTRLVPE